MASQAAGHLPWGNVLGTAPLSRYYRPGEWVFCGKKGCCWGGAAQTTRVQDTAGSARQGELEENQRDSL